MYIRLYFENINCSNTQTKIYMYLGYDILFGSTDSHINALRLHNSQEIQQLIVSMDFHNNMKIIISRYLYYKI